MHVRSQGALRNRAAKDDISRTSRDAGRSFSAHEGARGLTLRFLVHQFLRWAQHRAEAADASPKAAQEKLHRQLARAVKGTRIASVQDARIWDDLESYRRYVRIT